MGSHGNQKLLQFIGFLRSAMLVSLISCPPHGTGTKGMTFPLPVLPHVRGFITCALGYLLLRFWLHVLL